VGHHHLFVFSQKLLDTQGCVGGGIVMVEEPIPTLPLFWTISSQALTRSFQRIQVKLLIYCLSWRNTPCTVPSTLKREINIVLKLERTCCPIFGLGEFGDFH
jgi:hypothetical protein